MQKRLLSAGSLSGLICVALGAFGAHALKTKLAPEPFAIFETAVRYQFYHTLSILILAALSGTIPEGKLKIAGNFFIAGILLFSGSLYLMTASYLFADEPYKWLGAITPFGGLSLMAGWLSLFLFTIQTKTN
jgi:uncharacterized membrane protein YgdD (TMEM256/DUF423 family)